MGRSVVAGGLYGSAAAADRRSAQSAHGDRRAPLVSDSAQGHGSHHHARCKARGRHKGSVRDHRAYRTGKDLSELSGTERVRSASDAIGFELSPDIGKGLSYGEVRKALSEAAKSWMAPECTAVRFVDVGPATLPAKAADGVNTVQWVTDGSARGFEPQAAAMTDVQYAKDSDGQWKIAEADVYMNGGMSWSTGG